MLVLGGRTDTVGETVQLEVYDTETSEWKRFPVIQRFRHACWCQDTTLFLHGGFDNESPTVPTEAIMKLDALQVLKADQNLLEKVENFANSSGTASPSGKTDSGSTSPKSTGSRSPGGKNQIVMQKPHVEGKNADPGNSVQSSGNIDSIVNMFINHLL